MKLYRIGDFAKSLGISPKYLKYYEQKGLVQPFLREDNGYRYYVSPQAVHLAEYGKLQRIGFSLEQSKFMLQDADLSQYLISLEEQQNALEAQIAQLQAARDELEQLREHLTAIQSGDPWLLCEIAPFFFLPGEDGNAGSWDTPDGSGTPFWRLPKLPQFWQRACLTSSGAIAGRKWGCVLQPETDTIPDYALPVIGGTFFVYAHSIPALFDESGTYLQNKVWDFQQPLQLLRERHLVPRGDLYQQRLCLTHEKDGPLVHVLTLIPLRTDQPLFPESDYLE